MLLLAGSVVVFGRVVMLSLVGWCAVVSGVLSFSLGSYVVGR